MIAAHVCLWYGYWFIQLTNQTPCYAVLMEVIVIRRVNRFSSLIWYAGYGWKQWMLCVHQSYDRWDHLLIKTLQKILWLSYAVTARSSGQIIIYNPGNIFHYDVCLAVIGVFHSCQVSWSGQDTHGILSHGLDVSSVDTNVLLVAMTTWTWD